MFFMRNLACQLAFVLIGWAVLTCGVLPSQANAQIKSPDGQIEVTIQKDGTIKAINKMANGEWDFPGEGSKIPKGKNFQTTFAPDQKGAPSLYVVYGNELFCLDGRTGKWLWKAELGGNAPKNASFAFQGQAVVVTIDGKQRTFEMKTGKEK